MTARPGQIDELKAVIAAREGRAVVAPPAPPSMEDVRRAVAEEIAKLCAFSPEHIREEQELLHRLGLSPLDHIALALALEDRLSIRDRALVEFEWRTVADVVRDAAREAGVR